MLRYGCVHYSNSLVVTSKGYILGFIVCQDFVFLILCLFTFFLFSGYHYPSTSVYVFSLFYLSSFFAFLLSFFLPNSVLLPPSTFPSLHFSSHPIPCKFHFTHFSLFWPLICFPSSTLSPTLSLPPHPPDIDDIIFQVPPAQTFHQISQDSPSHSAAQMRCSESFLVAKIPLLASLVSHTEQTCGVILAFQ